MTDPQATTLTNDVSQGQSDNISKPSQQNDQQPVRKRQDITSAVNYHGTTISMAAMQGNLPVCVLLWGIAAAKKTSLIQRDAEGNTPMHFAALADTTEVIGFFIQQTRGMFDESTRLVHVANNNGETPLLKAAQTGRVAIIKSLLDEGSNPMQCDAQGATMFMLLAKHCHLWAINYFYDRIKSTYGVDATLNLLHAVDKDGSSALFYAAQGGDVNCIEYFIRRGLDVYSTNTHKHTVLHMAVKFYRVDAARYLMCLGCDAFATDAEGNSPHSMQLPTQDVAMKQALHHTSYGKIKFDAMGSPILSHNERSFAIYRLAPTRLRFALAYSIVVFAIWCLMICIPFWIYLPVLGCVAYAYNYYGGQVSSLMKRAHQANGRLILSLWQELLGAQEKYVGFYMGCMSAYSLYFIACIVRYTTDKKVLNVSMLLWAAIVWVWPDPGMVDTRERDFEEVMEYSLKHGGDAPTSTHCRTTLVRKPLRAKYCTVSGFVVSRMDHYCVWLCGCVGEGNHRKFMIFLISLWTGCLTSLVLLCRMFRRETEVAPTAQVFGLLFSEKWFFMTGLTAFAALSFLALGVLLVEQLGNMALNRTTNEKINWSRYDWMTDRQGKYSNRFHKGILRNILEFWHIPGFTVHYNSIYDTGETPRIETMSSMHHVHTDQCKHNHV